MLENQDTLLQQMIDQKNIAENDLETCKTFHIFFVPVKKYDKVPIVLTKKMKTVMDTLINHRSEVGIKGNILFVKSSNRPVSATQSLERTKKNVTLKSAKDLTANGLRQQAATF